MNLRQILSKAAACLLLQLTLISSVFAGDPGPYQLVFLDISEPPYNDGQKLAIELRRLPSLPEGCFFCDNSYPQVRVVYLYTIPVGLSTEEVKKAVKGDQEAKRRMQTVLANFTDHDGKGVDGLLIYQHQEGKVTIYSMDTQVGSKLGSTSKPVKNYLLHSSLDTMLEKAAALLYRPV